MRTLSIRASLCVLEVNHRSQPAPSSRKCRAFYTDWGLALAPDGDAGELSAPALHDLRQLIRDALAPVLEDDDGFAQWVGRHMTAPRRPRLGGEEYPPKPLWAMGGPVEEEEGVLQGFPALMSDWGSAREVVTEIRWVSLVEFRCVCDADGSPPLIILTRAIKTHMQGGPGH